MREVASLNVAIHRYIRMSYQRYSECLHTAGIVDVVWDDFVPQNQYQLVGRFRAYTEDGRLLYSTQVLSEMTLKYMLMRDPAPRIFDYIADMIDLHMKKLIAEADEDPFTTWVREVRTNAADSKAG